MNEKYKINHIFRDDNDPDKTAIEFEIRDKDDELVANVWGENANDVEVDCEHPYDALDFTGIDDDECGKCEICGADVHWHREKVIEDNYPESIDEVEEIVPDSYDIPETPGGLIGKILVEGLAI